MITQGTTIEGNLVNPTLANDRTVPENRADVGLNPILEGHVGIETVPALGNHVDKVTLILENHVDRKSVCIQTDMLTKDRTLLRIRGLTTLLWMPWAEPCARLLDHHSRKRSSRPRCQVDSHDHHLIRTMGEQTRWNMLVITST